MHILVPLFQIGPQQLQRSVFIVDFPLASPADSLDYIWQYMAEGTFITADEEFVEEFRVLG